jgi:hypothetical protein
MRASGRCFRLAELYSPRDLNDNAWHLKSDQAIKIPLRRDPLVSGIRIITYTISRTLNNVVNINKKPDKKTIGQPF